MKTYYDILEISKYASDEVLNRAHKVLIKKYHPDLESDQKLKKEKEEHIKKINEAYETLSDESKRKEYDLKVFGSQDHSKFKNTNNSEDNIVDQKRADEIYVENQERIIEEEYQKILDKELEEAQSRIDAEEKSIRENLQRYEREYLKSLGYKAYEPINWKRLFLVILTVIIILFLIFLIYILPPVKNKINAEIDSKSALGTLFGLIKGIYTAIGSIFTNIFRK